MKFGLSEILEKNINDLVAKRGRGIFFSALSLIFTTKNIFQNGL
jgi:hypothetical protein